MAVPPMVMNWQNQYCQMTTLQKAIPMLNKIFIRILIVFFTELEKKGPKFIWKHKDPEEPKQTSGGATLAISQ